MLGAWKLGREAFEGGVGGLLLFKFEVSLLSLCLFAKSFDRVVVRDPVELKVLQLELLLVKCRVGLVALPVRRPRG